MPKGVIGVVGLGYVGLTTAIVLAYYGYEVVGVDVDAGKIETLKKGRLPIYEPGLEDLFRASLERGLLAVASDYRELSRADIIFVTVGTPSLSDGSINLSYVYAAARNLGRILASSRSEYPVIAIKSTVLPGTSRRVAKIIEKTSGLRLGIEFGVASNPEFLREGSAVEDMLKPSRVVIGELDEKGASMLEGFWQKFYGDIGVSTPILRVKAETAEMIKYASNSFLALKISFANMLARICEKTPGCDVVDVVRGMGLDPRINPQFLGAGLGYGGSCFPKDVKALASYARKLCVDASLLEAVDRINETQPLHAAEILEGLLGSLEGKNIAVLGVAFKPETDDIRESRGAKLAALLLERGAKVRLHDPNERALDRAKRILGEKVVYTKTVEEALKDADAAVIATEWSHYKNLDPQLYLRYMRRPLLLDARRIYDPQVFARAGVEYHAIGLGDRP